MSDKIVESSNSPSSWESKALEQLLTASVKEQRASRRWGIFFKSAFLGYFLLLLYLLIPQDSLVAQNKAKPHTALIDISGVIENGGDSARSTADNVAYSLNAAFKDKNTQGIILRINSPGGSPVQAAYIYDEIRRLSQQHKSIKVYTVCTDVCASAAYYIAAASHKIYANPASLVGSIGVLIDDFGFVNALDKLGVQRRLLTAGSHKGFLDPFSPLKPEDEKFAKAMLDDIHQQFIQSVIQGRGKRLKNDPNLFSGLAWTGNQAKNLGLIDDFGSAGFVAREVIKQPTIVDYTIRPSYLEAVASRMGISFTKNLKSQLQLNSLGVKLH